MQKEQYTALLQMCTESSNAYLLPIAWIDVAQQKLYNLYQLIVQTFGDYNPANYPNEFPKTAREWEQKGKAKFPRETSQSSCVGIVLSKSRITASEI